MDPGKRSPQALGRRTASGMLWLVAQTLVTKPLTLIQQIVLSWLLVPEDFGLFGLAMTVLALLNFADRAGLREVLIQRHDRFHRWATPVFWMSLTLGLGSGALMAAAAPLAAAAYDSPNLAPVVILMALMPLLQSLESVPIVRLQSDMRFSVVAKIGVAAMVVQVIVAIALGWAGTGAYALVFSRVAMTGFRSGMFWAIARPTVQMRLRLRRWRLLLGDSARMSGGRIGRTICNQGDYMMLGAFHSEAVVGLYFWGFNLSTQTIQLFTRNLTVTLLPALSKLKDEPARQMRAFVRGGTLVGLVGVPVCLMEAAVAEPLVYMIFDRRWYPAIPTLQLLCVGMAVRLIAGPASTFLMARGRFGTYMRLSLLEGAGIIGASAIAANLGAATSVAFAVACIIGILGPLRAYTAIRELGGRPRDVAMMFGGPLAMGLAAASASLIVQRLVGLHTTGLGGWRQPVVLASGVGTMIAAYTALALVYMRSDCADLSRRLKDLLKRRGGGAMKRDADPTDEPSGGP